MDADGMMRTLHEIHARRIRAQGWDAPQRLLLVHDDEDNGEYVPYEMGAFEAAVTNAPPGTTPAQVLAAFARVTMAAGASWPHRVEAVVFCSEAWMVKADADNEQHASDVVSDARKRTIHQRADRVEVRTMTCVDRHGAVRAIMWERDREDKPMEFNDADGVDAASERLGGDIAMGVKAVMAAMAARSQ
jgi:hypothetical protein